MPVTFDVDALKAELELDHEDVVELMQEFREFLTQSIDELGKAVSSKNFDEVRSISHSIKGSAGNLRVTEVYETAKGMQFDIDEGEEEKALARFPTLQEKAQAFLAESENFS